MATQAESSSAVLPQHRLDGVAIIYWHGIAAGLFGATVLALWFLSLDVARGHPLYTPTVLGMALFQRGEGLEHLASVPPSIRMTLMFTVVHGIVFILLGVAVARLLNIIEGRPSIGMAILVLFVVLQFGFLAFALTFAAVTVNALGMPEVVIGNVLAAAAMGGYLWWHAPVATREVP